MEGNILKEAIKGMADSYLNYLHIFSWLKMKAHKHLVKRVFSFNSVEKFWDMIFTEELRHGDVIKIKGGFLSDWIPRIAGQSWKDLKDKSISSISLDTLKKGEEFSISSLVESETKNLPFGSVRLPTRQRSNNFTVLSITTYDAWSIDLSIPIIVSREVYNSFLKTRKNNQAVEGDIEAVLEINPNPLFDTALLKAYGSTLSKDFLDQFAAAMTIPRVHLKLIPPFSKKFRTHNSHPRGCVWTLNKIEDTIGFKINRNSGNIEYYNIEPYYSFGMHAAHININDSSIIELYAGAFIEGHTVPKTLFPDISVSKSPGRKTTVLTEFDGQRRYFSNSIPITDEPWRKKATKDIILSTLKDFESLSGK